MLQPQERRGDRSIVMQAVSNHGLTLAYASDELVADHEIVMAAVADCGLALQFADEALRSDYEIVMKAASNEGLAASSASQTFAPMPRWWLLLWGPVILIHRYGQCASQQCLATLVCYSWMSASVSESP